MEQEEANHLQAALRGYEAARQRLSLASEPVAVRSATENYLVAKRRFKEAIAKADKDIDDEKASD